MGRGLELLTQRVAPLLHRLLAKGHLAVVQALLGDRRIELNQVGRKGVVTPSCRLLAGLFAYHQGALGGQDKDLLPGARALPPLDVA